MSEARKSKGLYWMVALVSLVVTILLLMFANAWFWVGLPFLITSIVLAMDVM